MTRPRLICIPSDDAAFAAHARDLLDGLALDLYGTPHASVRDRFSNGLASLYPTAVVRERHPLASLWPEEGPVWYAIRRSYTSRLAATVDIPADRKRVFDVYVKRMPEWQVVVDLEPLADRPGASATEYLAAYNFMGRRLEGRLRVVDASPPRAVRVEATGMGVDVWYVTTFRTTSHGTRVEVRGDYNLPSRLIPAAMGRLVVEKRIARDIERAHAALRDLCTRAPVDDIVEPPSDATGATSPTLELAPAAA